MTRAHALHRLGRSDEAETLFRQAIRDQPHRGGPRLSLAGMLFDLGRTEDAHTVLLEGVKALPNHFRLWYLLGDSHAARGQHEDALEAYRTSVRLARGPVGFAWIRLALGHARLGHREEADRWLARATAWIDANAPENEELKRLRAETERTLAESGGDR
jgi:predicted Zn-dependent protease